VTRWLLQLWSRAIALLFAQDLTWSEMLPRMQAVYDGIEQGKRAAILSNRDVKRGRV